MDSKTQEVEAVIVGSGIAGAMLAQGLLAQGMGSVLMLEAGPPIKMADPRTWYDFVMNGNNPFAPYYDLPGDYTVEGHDPWALDGNGSDGGRLFGAGGATLHWGGLCPRMKPDDFVPGKDSQYGIDWPYDYDTLEPYYCQAESAVGVSGDSKQQDPPRSKPYPYVPAPFPETEGLVITAMETLGISYEHLAITRYATGDEERNACMTTGTCKYCPIGGRYSADQSLDQLAPNKKFKLLTGAPVLQVRMASKGKAAGVTYLDMASRKMMNVDAHKVFLTNGALEIPKLLLASRSTAWPKGVGNDADLVGRHLAASPFISVMGTLPSNPKRMVQELNFATLCSRYWDTPKDRKTGKLLIYKAPWDPMVNMAKMMNANNTSEQIAKATTGPIAMTLLGELQPLSQYENRVSLDRGTTRFGLPRTLIDTPKPIFYPESQKLFFDRIQSIFKAMGAENLTNIVYPQRGDHAMGTCRMSKDASTGVVNANLQVHGVDNLFVISNAVLPSTMTANPTLTMVAILKKWFAENKG
ncbi:MAG: GMC family oxidoreductase [Magnetococcales bacterium]|nr:GMC family oxidoreductase [Magnetococcales bacterium]